MNLEAILQRYTQHQQKELSNFLDFLAKTTRKTGKISETAKVKILTTFVAFDTDIVIASIQAYMNMNIAPAKHGKGMNEKYVCGIMSNKQAEKNGGKPNGHNRRHSNGKSTTNGNNSETNQREDEGERIWQLAESTTGGSLDCDF